MKDKETLEESSERIISDMGWVWENTESSARMVARHCAKWQKEQMYSDEDMMFAYEQGARLALLSQSPLALHKGEFPNPDDRFEQFKKK